MSRLAHLDKLINDPDFQRRIQTEIRRKAAAYNSSIIYRDRQGRMLVEYPGSGQVYEQNAAQQLTLLSLQGQLVKGVTPIAKTEADQVQTT
ncbi:hypothetical protein [Hymenobacter coccineus]|uniref:Uncharacterized protein n=1 Tax=Hymenobacter coccineus TaxID=1908235 RepID=A0A1G1TGM9_9BACT|nr:hypothetical protein [Hymenobacter coccineus]OGX90019.1 hypothetical protein BEN49_07755 [Hymenobacter coccineus]